jgi:galactokinase
MTGGGFGGCAVVLAETAAIPALTAAVQAAFATRFGSKPELFASTACEGAKEHF